MNKHQLNSKKHSTQKVRTLENCVSTHETVGNRVLRFVCFQPFFHSIKLWIFHSMKMVCTACFEIDCFSNDFDNFSESLLRIDDSVKDQM